MLQWRSNYNQLLNKKTAVLLGVVFLAVFLFNFFVPNFALAQTPPGPGPVEVTEGLRTIEEPLGLPSTDIRIVVANIIRAALGLLGILLVGLLLYAGYLWLTAGGNEEQIEQSKKLIRNAVIGLLLILSAFAIVTFVMRMLGVGEGGGQTVGGGGTTGGTEFFSGSGALGGIIKDHYPARDEADVARNTKIILTFRKAVKPDSFITNTNNSRNEQGAELFGDCTNIGANMNWQTDCDQLKLDAEHINITRADNNEQISGAAVVASYETGKVFTVVIRPIEYLGSSESKVGYKVRVGKGILIDDPTNNNPSIFTSKVAGNDYYEWQFACSTELDTGAPVVKSVFPGDGARETKNVVVQVDFSEAMDPTVMQGSFQNAPGVDYFFLQGRNVFLKSGASTIPLGRFTLTNGYRTLEFTPSIECGVNACGGKIFCMPVCDRAGAGCSEDGYELLLKAARTFSASAFEAIPFSGIMDVAGNALDGNNNNRVDSVSTSTLAVFPDQKVPDNFFWNFRLRNEIDATAPYAKQVTPGLDAANVQPRENIEVLFSKRMRVEPMYDIGLDQQPATAIPICKVPRVTFLSNGTTQTIVSHCPFLNNKRYYYLPSLTSAIEDVHFNCFYPGKGPGGEAQVIQNLPQSLVCDERGINCCTVTSTLSNKSVCCNGTVRTEGGTTQTCVDYLRGISL